MIENAECIIEWHDRLSTSIGERNESLFLHPFLSVRFGSPLAPLLFRLRQRLDGRVCSSLRYMTLMNRKQASRSSLSDV